MQTCTYKDYEDREAAKLLRRHKAFDELMDALEQCGGVATVDEVAGLLNATPTSVVGQVNSGRLIGIVDREHQSYRIPMFQFDVSTKLPHLEDLLAALGDVSGAMACTWFLNSMFPNAEADHHWVPFVMLRAGVGEIELKSLLHNARNYGQPSAK
jgi:hypothetical protein